MQTKTTTIAASVLLSIVIAYWLSDEKRTVKRINPTSYRKQVGLGFRHERNDVVGLTLTGAVVRTQPDATSSK